MFRWLAAGMVIGFVGCHGGGGADVGDASPAADADTTGPSVRMTNPGDGVTGVALTTDVSVSFDEVVAATTLTPSSFTLVTGDGAVVDATVSTLGSDATLTPSVALEPDTEYTATVTTEVTDVSGNALAADYSWSFTTRPRAWSAPAGLETGDPGDSNDPRIAVNASGQAMAVWHQWEGTTIANIWASRYVPGSGWQPAALIESNDVGRAVLPRVAISDNGNAVAVWHQADVFRDNIWANYYVAGTGWGTPVIIETDDTGDAQNAQVAIDDAGNAIAVWAQSDSSIWANRYNIDTGWGTPELIETGDGAAAAPRIAMTGGGDAIAVWTQYDGVRNSVWLNRYSVGSGWGAAELVEHYDGGDAADPDVAINDAGTVVVAWNQVDDNGTPSLDMWANRYIVGNGWGTATLLETLDAAVEPAEVALDPAGDAVVVWRQFDGVRASVWASNYVVGAGWTTATLLENDDYGAAGDVHVDMDSAGNAIAVWEQLVSFQFYSVFVNRYVAGVGWGTREPLPDSDAATAGQPRVAVDGSGNALAVWVQFPTIRGDIWTARFF